MSEHTPGPWSYPPGQCGIIAASGVKVAHVRGDHDEHSDECTTCANGHMLAAAPDFVDACQGPDPDVDRLSWLSALLTELEDSAFASECEDPQAVGTAMLECRLLCDGLRAAVRKAKGEQS